MKSIAKNRKAYHDYIIEDKWETGIVLTGPEVKSLRKGHGSMIDGYAQVKDHELWLFDCFIPKFQQASYNNADEKRRRKLLMHSHQIKKLFEATKRDGYTLVPLEFYFNQDNIVKVTIGLGKGKNKGDKREAAKVADAKKEAQRAMRRQ